MSLAPAFRPGPNSFSQPRAGGRIGSETADPSVGFAISLTTGMCRLCGTQICGSSLPLRIAERGAPGVVRRSLPPDHSGLRHPRAG